MGWNLVFRRTFVFLAAGSVFAWGATDAVSADQAAARVEQLASTSPAALRPEFRVLAAQALKERYPAQADKFVHAAFADLQSRPEIDTQLLSALTSLAPEETIALLPHLKSGSEEVVISALVQSNRLPQAVALYRASLQKGASNLDAFLLRSMAKENPEEAKKLFNEIVAAFPFETAPPSALYRLIGTGTAIAPVAPDLAADLYDRVLAIVSAPDYRKDQPAISATFTLGSATIATENSRDTLLIAAAAHLRLAAPDRLAKYKAALARWDLVGEFKVKSVTLGDSNRPQPSPAAVAISARLRQLRSLSDAERPAEVLALAKAIEALPKGSKLGWASSLASLATEGDNGREAMTAVAAAIGRGIREEAAPSAWSYLELASLIRYERVPAPFADPALETADALLALRERVHQDAGFTLTGMDGKTYSLDALRGKVVLLNFWATWCPPCRKEMPDMQILSRRFEKKGLIVLAVSDEERETVAAFLAKQPYTFPVLLDPNRKAHDAFGVEGIPKSFIFDAQGKLVAHAIDMRTERQFLELLKQAGLE